MTKHDCKSGVRLTQNKIDQERSIKVNKIHYMHKLKDDPSRVSRPVPFRMMEGCLVLTTEDQS